MNYEQTRIGLQHLALIVILTGFDASGEGLYFKILNPPFTLDNHKLNKVAVYEKNGKFMLFYDHKSGGGEVAL